MLQAGILLRRKMFEIMPENLIGKKFCDSNLLAKIFDFYNHYITIYMLCNLIFCNCEQWLKFPRKYITVSEIGYHRLRSIYTEVDIQR